MGELPGARAGQDIVFPFFSSSYDGRKTQFARAARAGADGMRGAPNDLRRLLAVAWCLLVDPADEFARFYSRSCTMPLFDRTLVIIEDNSQLAHDVHSRFVRRGFKATLASAPDECLPVLQRGDAELVILDLTTGWLTPVEAWVRLRANGIHAAAVLAHARGSTSRFADSLRSGAFCSLSTSVSVNMFCEAVERALQAAGGFDEPPSGRRSEPAFPLVSLPN